MVFCSFYLYAKAPKNSKLKQLKWKKNKKHEKRSIKTKQITFHADDSHTKKRKEDERVEYIENSIGNCFSTVISNGITSVVCLFYLLFIYSNFHINMQFIVIGMLHMRLLLLFAMAHVCVSTALEIDAWCREEGNGWK